MADLKISQLPALASAFVAAGDELPIVDASASETKKVSADGLVNAGIRLMPSAAIPWAKIDATGMVVPDNSVTTAKVVDGAISTIKIADGAVTDAKIAGPISLSKLGNQAANVVLAGPATGAAAPTFRALAPADLPVATASTLGAVSINTGAGLAVDANGAVSLSSSVTAGTKPVVTYDQYGRITAGRDLLPADLPIASASLLGGVMIGTGLSVDAAGLVKTALTAAEIPGLDATKIVSGEFASARFANRSITQAKLADYSISYIQEAQPSAVVADHPIGELWFQESTAKLSMWNGNSWMAVGQGALSGQNLRFCGTFDATTGQISSLTTFGTSDGFNVGVAIPAADNKYTGAYFVCATPGNGSAVAVGVSFDAGDWILCISGATGWQRIDTLNGGGGGGGASVLDALSDVTVTTPATGDVLTYTGTIWVNRQGNLDPGTYS